MHENKFNQKSQVLIKNFELFIKATQNESSIWNELSLILKDVVGYRLFTVLRLHANGIDVERVFSTDTKAYPVGGRKALRRSPWAEMVLDKHLHFIGCGKKDIEWAFEDHELIASLDLQAVLNMPLVQRGRCYGSLNLLTGGDNIYTEEDAQQVKPFAALAVTTLSRIALST